MVEDEPSETKSIIHKFFSFWWLVAVWCFWAIWTLLTISVIAYIIFGLLFLYSTEAKMEIIFSNRIRTPWFANLSSCKDFGLVKCENIYLNGNAGKLGAWFISPSSKQYISREAYILYLHGNIGTRGLKHRVNLYKILSKMGYHILAIDYRGFGDSDGWPTEEGLVEDSKVAYKWLLEKAHGYPKYIWGHSLGSAVGVQLASWVNAEKSRLNGVFLEAPFNNLTDSVIQNPIALPAVQFIRNIEEYFDDIKNVFKSSYWIQKVTTATLILHDKSDHIININLGRKLYLASKSVGTTNVKMHEFDEKLYHCKIYAARHLKELVRTPMAFQTKSKKQEIVKALKASGLNL